jgi:triacylglycerol esterase/lipase EstA (alpha/beta hydrolase family)
MLARLQKFLALTLALVAVVWVVWILPVSLMLALAGLALLALGHALFLAIEFMAVYFVNKRDTVPHAGVVAMVRAWVGESIMAPRGVNSKRGVVFVHGFVCNRGFWNPWMAQLQGRGNAFAAVNLEPVFGSIHEYVPQIEAAVAQVTKVTGLPPVVICHSMGGLAVRAWLRANHAAGQPDSRVHHIVTIGSPHHGTWLSRFAFSANGTQMRRQGEWLQTLARDEPESRMARFTCFYSNCDNIVFPASTAMLPGADNRLVKGAAHVDMAFDDVVIRQSLAMLESAT